METQHKHKFSAIILAAGKGTRMRSGLPKVLHKLANKPMISHVIASLAPMQPETIAVVVAPGMEAVQQATLAENNACIFATQAEQKGTGHAVKTGLTALSYHAETILVLYGDTPLIQTETLETLLREKAAHKAAIALLAMNLPDPTGYGRLSMRDAPFVERIIECKDANAEEKKLGWVWGGVMAFDAAFLREALENLAPSPVTGEYYLTALVEMAAAKGLRSVMVPMKLEEAMGVNDRAQLAQAEAVMQQRLRLKAMLGGATLVAPETVFLSADTALGKDVTLHPHVVFGPNVSIADNVEIRSYSHIEGAHIASGAIIGPFARLRPGSIIAENAHVGNFVELKQTKLGKGAKANHLSYIGDSEIGEGANIGAGTITCNYDGIAKHKTLIGAGAFIGSNSALVAPVSIGAGAIVGAGSVITQDVEADALAIARGMQVNKPGGAKAFRQSKQKQ